MTERNTRYDQKNQSAFEWIEIHKTELLAVATVVLFIKNRKLKSANSRLKSLNRQLNVEIDDSYKMASLALGVADTAVRQVDPSRDLFEELFGNSLLKKGSK